MELHTTRPSRSRLKPVRVFSGALLAGCAGLLMVLASGTQAHAVPSPGEIEARIDEAWNKLEPLIEQHNGVKVQLAENKAKAAKLADQIRPLELQVDMAMGRVSSYSVEAYKHGQASTLNALLTSGSPNTLADQLSMLDAMAKNEQARIADVAKLKAQYDALKKPLDEVVNKLAAQEGDLAAKSKTINDEIALFNKMRVEAYGSNASLGNLRPAACPAAYDGSLGSKAAQVACQQIGKTYIFGTEGPNTFDCSGLTKFAWARATGGRVSLYHYTNTQFSTTKRIDRNQLRPGDLVFYYADMHHMGMYVGNDWVVHAPRSGDQVRMQPLGRQPISGYGRPNV